jgi:hypothetical protein
MLSAISWLNRLGPVAGSPLFSSRIRTSMSSVVVTMVVCWLQRSTAHTSSAFSAPPGWVSSSRMAATVFWMDSPSRAPVLETRSVMAADRVSAARRAASTWLER